jgi:hypothetical protein
MSYLKLGLILMLTYVVLSSCKENSDFQTIEYENKYQFSDQIQNELKESNRFGKHQYAAWDYAFKADYKNALIEWDIARTPQIESFSKEEKDSLKNKYTVLNASEYISKISSQYEIIIINEAHHNSYHRFFTKKLLKKLFQKGYRNLGLEALANGKERDTKLNSRGFPNLDSGFYIKDPQFADLVRTALDLGYNVFPYEQTSGSSGKQREIEQAKNIQAFLKKQKKGKTIIHCGFGHAFEGAFPGLEKTMAGRLKEYTGFDPLTIDQVAYSEKSTLENSHPLLNTFRVKESSILIEKDTGKPLKYTQGTSETDIAVLHPFTSYTNNRPDWMFSDEKSPISIDFSELKLDFPIMVFGYLKIEGRKNTIPVDIVEITDKQDNNRLLLKGGLYEIILSDRKGKSFTKEISVKPKKIKMSKSYD